ncbi:hypothetical protein [Pseudooceanicola sp. LIPI14-2-Ac024]|uniref:hypothetical protein n=1 Tax=Pseudooceanicola sp. LIPI14-2-Ac024 TaxID=3344875 RepID=UPI0035D07098
MDAQISADPQAFLHIRMVLSMITSLAVARLLTGAARFVQHPGRDAVYPLHLAWVAFFLIAVMRFWWFEYALTTIGTLTFFRYAFVSFFAALHFLLATLLFPDDIKEYEGFRGYFEARRSWFFALLAVFFAIDAADTWLKGASYIALTSPGFPLVQLALVAGAVVTIFVANRAWNVAFVILATAAQFLWIARLQLPVSLH